MADLIVVGGKKLSGTTTPSGNKNSVLPIICATILTDDNVTLKNVPDLTDINKLVENLRELGSEISWDKEKKTLTINNKNLTLSESGGDLPVGMRGSVLLFAPLLSKLKEINIQTEIGGCTLGIRELDPHLEVLESLGSEIKTENGYIKMKIGKRFIGNDLWQEYMSVTTTENFIMGATLAKGRSTMVNAASEPHVQDLCNMLNSMGAKISGIGTSKITVDGVEKLSGTEFKISSDHHEITTLLALGAMTGGEVRVTDSLPKHFPLISKTFRKLGVNIEWEDNVAVVRKGQKLKIEQPYTQNLLPKIEAAPWPYFPVDLLPLMVALSVKAEGSIMFWNKVYEGGLLWIPEMTKFGAQIVMADPHRIIVYGNKPLEAATVNSPNIIRVAVALMMVALTVEGKSVVKHADSIKRAHPNFVENLQALGADIKWQESNI